MLEGVVLPGVVLGFGVNIQSLGEPVTYKYVAFNFVSLHFLSIF